MTSFELPLNWPLTSRVGGPDARSVIVMRCSERPHSRVSSRLGIISAAEFSRHADMPARRRRANVSADGTEAAIHQFLSLIHI